MTAPFDDIERRLIAGGAMTLFERLSNLDALEPGRLDESGVTEFLETWRDRFPTEAAFERRLNQAEVSVEECRRAVGHRRLASDQPIPEWVDRLAEIVAAVQARGFDDRDGTPADPTERPPFDRVTTTIATVVRQRLPDEPVGAVLTDEAIESAVEWFRGRLQSLLVRVLYVECKTFVAAHDRERAFADPTEFESSPTEYYEAFLAYLSEGGFGDLCVEYPMLARLLETQCRQFEEYLRELCRRLRADRDAIADRFGDGDLGAVVDLQPLADDTHRGGRAVTYVAFDSGVEVVYKPRSVDAGEVFYRVLGRLDDHLSVADFWTPTYLPRGEYGYMEYVEYDECSTRAAVERYYRRAGVLIAVAYFLEFVDCQYENLLAAGDQPTLLDVETVLHPYFSTARRPVRKNVDALRRDSVLLTALLAHTVGDVYEDDGPELNAVIAGLGISSEPAEIEHVQFPRIEAPNTDVMSVEEVSPRVDRSENVPSFDGTDQPPAEFLDEIVAGFEDAYETILGLRSADRLSEIGLPDAFAGIDNRVVYRPTIEYANVVRSLRSRRALSDGAAFSVELDRLAVPFCDGRVGEPKPWSIYDAERETLGRFDPPRLESRTDATEVRLADHDFSAVADASGIERCRQRIESADRADMREQIEFVRGSCGAEPSPASVRDERLSPRPVSDDRLLEEARALFERVREAGVETDGTYDWATIEPWTAGNGKPMSLLSVDDSLYFGRCGIALFGAALYRVTGESSYRRFALDSVRPVREALTAGTRADALDHLGGALGIGSVAYGLAAVGDLLDDRTVVDDAHGVVDHLSTDRIETDDDYDVIGGAAGTILGLLAVNDRSSSPELVDVAIACGDHLLDASRMVGDGRAWDTFGDSEPLAGFAHGTGGIAYALARLSDATGRTVYRDAAIEAIEYESAAYSPEAGNWPDYRTDEWAEGYTDQWCHGRSGIGLARIGMAEYVPEAVVTGGIDRAVSTFDHEIGLLDHLCCGNAGRAAFLLAAERRRGTCVGQARSYLGATLARKEATGSYQLHSITERIVDPSLFMGLSGIGYTMLRVTAPDELPAVLLWE